MLFADFFYGLRNAGVKVGLSEWMGLMKALSTNLIAPSLKDFYVVARALLIKNEAHFDAYDQVFSASFADGDFPKADLEKLVEWLTNPLMLQMSQEELAKLEALPFEELRKRFEERLREQKERHDGGNRHIGTGGTSPFGHNGANPSGVRVGGSGGGKSAVQIAEERRYQDYRQDRVLDTRLLSVALKKLRRLSRNEGEPELDVDESIDKTCKNAGELELAFLPPRKNNVRVLLLMDVGGSMDPYSYMAEQLFSAAANLNTWKKFEAFFFHNCPYETIFSKISTGEGTPTAEFIRERSKDTLLLIVGDADMAPSELMSRYGALSYGANNLSPGITWLHRLRSHFTRSVWLNPLAPKYWEGGYTIQMINRLFPMYPLTVEGIELAIDRLLRRTPELIPELTQDWFR
jgi:uncharacterized protein